MSSASELWKEKKEYLQQQLAITADPAQKFALRKHIEECEAEIAQGSNQESQTNKKASTENQQNQQAQYPQQDIPQITFNTPQIMDVGINKLKEVIPQVQILLLTVNDWERKALLSEMTPLDGQQSILQGALSTITYRIGIFGNYCAAYTESTMGSGGRHGATLTAKIAVDELKPKAVLLLGIAFGIDSSKQKLGDVLIAESIQPYDFQKIHNDFSITFRGQATPCGHILSERFRMCRSDWIAKCGDTSFDTVRVHQGLVLSGDKLVNNLDFRHSLVKAFPTSIGGEMEGAGAYSAISPLTEVILIKSICDWADGDKNDLAQPFASFTAVSLAKHVLSKRDVLHPLIDTHSNTQPNNQTQNIDHNSTTNQLITATNNSSVSDVIQVAGSINNSTIDIHLKPNLKATTMDRTYLFNTLNGLVTGQFNQLLFEINPPNGLIPPTPAAQAERVSALLQWAESPTGCGLNKIQQVLENILNPH